MTKPLPGALGAAHSCSESFLFLLPQANGFLPQV